jgi:hypothetical protein
LNLQDNLIDYLEINDFFLLRLISTHHNFRNSDIIKYSGILKWGSGVQTNVENDPYYQQYSFAKFGLCFNNNIDWTDVRILTSNNFEANSWQWTGYDENSLPLSIEEEMKTRLSFIKLEFHPDNYYKYFDYNIPENLWEEMIENAYNDFQSNILPESKKNIEALKTDFNFSCLNDFFNYVKDCPNIACLNRSLYENFQNLCKLNYPNAIIEILEALFKNSTQQPVASIGLGE